LAAGSAPRDDRGEIIAIGITQVRRKMPATGAMGAVAIAATRIPSPARLLGAVDHSRALCRPKTRIRAGIPGHAKVSKKRPACQRAALRRRVLNVLPQTFADHLRPPYLCARNKSLPMCTERTQPMMWA
jgi:hypothetical protein